jgi:hypothetical protein
MKEVASEKRVALASRSGVGVFFATTGDSADRAVRPYALFGFSPMAVGCGHRTGAAVLA